MYVAVVGVVSGCINAQVQNACTLRKNVSQLCKYTAQKGVHTSQNTRKSLRLLRYISYVHRFSFRAPSIKGDRGTTIADQCRAYNKLEILVHTRVEVHRS